jgi:uncharacterized SAM-binding protein YcdF (DUF218 family)
MIFFFRKFALALIALVVVVVGVVVASAVLFVFPTTNQPRAADAIVVLGGKGPRFDNGVALAAKGYAPLLVLSLASPTPPSACQALSPRPSVQVICFVPSPLSTRGEARFIGQLAHQRHLHTIIVVSGSAQTRRARLRVSRCFSGTILMVPIARPSLLSELDSVVYEWGALAKAELWQRSC